MCNCEKGKEREREREREKKKDSGRCGKIEGEREKERQRERCGRVRLSWLHHQSDLNEEPENISSSLWNPCTRLSSTGETFK